MLIHGLYNLESETWTVPNILFIHMSTNRIFFFEKGILTEELRRTMFLFVANAEILLLHDAIETKSYKM